MRFLWGLGGDGGWARRDARGATPPARRSRPPPSLRAASAPSTAPFSLFCYIFLRHPTGGHLHLPGAEQPPRSPGSIPGRPRPPLSAPLARDNAIGGNRSFLIAPARGKLHLALCCRSPSPPQPARQSCRIGSGLAKLLGHGVGMRLGPHPPLAGASASLLLLWGAASPLLGGSTSLLLLGGPHPRVSPRGTHGSPGQGPPAEAALPTRPRRAFLFCKEKDNHHGCLQALAQALRSSASTPV